MHKGLSRDLLFVASCSVVYAVFIPARDYLTVGQQFQEVNAVTNISKQLYVCAHSRSHVALCRLYTSSKLLTASACVGPFLLGGCLIYYTVQQLSAVAVRQARMLTSSMI